MKFIRHDHPVNPHTRLILCDYNIIESDLIEILVLQVEDKKLSFWVIVLMALLTNPPHEDLNPFQKDKLNKSLLEYKLSFTKSEALTYLMIHIADFFKIEKEKRFLAHLQMLEFSIILIRNLLAVKEKDGDENTHFRFIMAMVKEEIFNPILYLIQLKDAPELLRKLDIVLLEICYHTFTCVNSELICRSEEGGSKISQLTAQRTFSSECSSRHSRFMPFFQNKTSFRHKIFHKISENDCSFEHQRKIPNRICDLMKIERIGHQYLPDNVRLP